MLIEDKKGDHNTIDFRLITERISNIMLLFSCSR